MIRMKAALVGAISLTALVALAPMTAHAQGGGQGRGQGRGFGGGFGQRGGMMQASLSTLPMPVLEKNLTLTEEQKTKIGEIQKKAQEEMRAGFGGGFGGGGGRPDPEEMRARMEKMQAQRKATDDAITAVLTDDQKKLVPALLKDVQLFQQAQLPVELITDLKLTDDQKKQIAEVSKKIQDAIREKSQEARDNQDFQAMREIMQQGMQAQKEKTRAILTADQKAMVEKWEKEHPQRGFGGGRGQGGRGGRGGGNGAPPPAL